MVRRLFLGLVTAVFGITSSVWVYATPSTTYWTPCTGDIQKFGVFHITYDSYTKDDTDFPNDYGLTVGVLPFENLQAEVGFDIFAPQAEAFLDNALYLNAKIGSPEGVLFNGSPAWNLGVFNIGFNDGVNDYDVAHVILSKTIGEFGRLHLGAYYGLTDTLEITASDGDGDRGGFMIGYDKGFWPVTQDGVEFNRFVFAADFMSGGNALGGGGLGLYYFFTPDISLLTGPVWFVDNELNGNWKWTLQLDINFKF